jgi:hypothetical protein
MIEDTLPALERYEEIQKHPSQYNLAKPQQADILLNTSANYQDHTTY